MWKTRLGYLVDLILFFFLLLLSLSLYLNLSHRSCIPTNNKVSRRWGSSGGILLLRLLLLLLLSIEPFTFESYLSSLKVKFSFMGYFGTGPFTWGPERKMSFLWRGMKWRKWWNARDLYGK